MEGSLVAYKVFTNGSVLPASDVNTYLMDQSVMVFSSSATRAAALTAPVEGMLTWLQDTNKYENYNGTAWVALGSSPILQVVSTAKTDTFTSSSGTFTDVTGLSVTITPSSATSKVLVQLSVNGNGGTASASMIGRLVRGSTAIAIGDAAGSRSRATFGNSIAAGSSDIINNAVTFLDSPATTSATTYKIQVLSDSSPNLVYINRSSSDGDLATRARSISTITVMEVAV